MTYGHYQTTFLNNIKSASEKHGSLESIKSWKYMHIFAISAMACYSSNYWIWPDTEQSLTRDLIENPLIRFINRKLDRNSEFTVFHLFLHPALSHSILALSVYRKLFLSNLRRRSLKLPVSVVQSALSKYTVWDKILTRIVC